MTTPTREAIFSALLTKLQGAYAWQTTSRRLKLWDDPSVGVDQMPCLFQYEGDHDESVYENDLILRRTLKCRLFVYINAKDPNIVGATQINNILDALDTALAPTGADMMTNRQTLGGLVSSCRIIGPVLKDPGDLDGIGLIVVPIVIVWP